MSFTAAAFGLLAMLAPKRCPGCDEIVDEEVEAFCGACEPLLERASGALATHAAFVYGGPLADAIRRYKYGGRSELATPLGHLFAREAARASRGRSRWCCQCRRIRGAWPSAASTRAPCSRSTSHARSERSTGPA